jgi:hypothetical protein
VPNVIFAYRFQVVASGGRNELTTSNAAGHLQLEIKGHVRLVPRCGGIAKCAFFPSIKRKKVLVGRAKKQRVLRQAFDASA